MFQAVKALIEVVQLGGMNLVIAALSCGPAMWMLPLEEIETYIAEIKEEMEKEVKATCLSSNREKETSIDLHFFDAPDFFLKKWIKKAE